MKMRIKMICGMMTLGALFGSSLLCAHESHSSAISLPEVGRLADALTLIVKQQAAPRPPCTYFIDFMQASLSVFHCVKAFPMVMLGSYTGWKSLQIVARSVTELRRDNYENAQEKREHRRKNLMMCAAGLVLWCASLAIVGHAEVVMSPFMST